MIGRGAIVLIARLQARPRSPAGEQRECGDQEGLRLTHGAASFRSRGRPPPARSPPRNQVTSPSGTGPRCPIAQPPRSSGAWPTGRSGRSSRRRAAKAARREARHHVWPDANRLGDLGRGRGLERRGDPARQVAALRHDLVAAGAVVGEQLLAVRKAAALGLRPRHLRPLAERRHVGDEGLDLLLGEQHPHAARLLTGLAQGHVAGAQVEVGREGADTRSGGPFLVAAVRAGAAGAVAGDAVARRRGARRG